MKARILLFRGVAIAPGGPREPLPIERKARALILLKPELGAVLEDLIEDLLERLSPGDGDDNGGRRAA